MTRPGRFLPVDADGYLLNDTSLDRLPSGWGAVVDAIVAEATAEHGERLHSVWVRGSAEAVAASSGRDECVKCTASCHKSTGW